MNVEGDIAAERGHGDPHTHGDPDGDPDIATRRQEFKDRLNWQSQQ